LPKRCCGHAFARSNSCSSSQWCVASSHATLLWTDHYLQCLCLCVLSAILLGILYLFFGAFPLVFRNNHGFSLSQTGLAFVGLLIGMLTGVCTDPIWRRVYGRLVCQREEQGGEPGGSEPEFRLPSTILGAWVVPIALFGKQLHAFDVERHSDCVSGFGWTTYPSVSGLWHMSVIFGG
jgi:hypothetical protein